MLIIMGLLICRIFCFVGFLFLLLLYLLFDLLNTFLSFLFSFLLLLFLSFLFFFLLLLLLFLFLLFDLLLLLLKFTIESYVSILGLDYLNFLYPFFAHVTDWLGMLLKYLIKGAIFALVERFELIIFWFDAKEAKH